jgi:hypothetical protein
MLLNIELAVKIGSRLIERLPPLDSLMKVEARRPQGFNRPRTPAMPGARTGKLRQLFGIEKPKGIVVPDSMKLPL